MKWKYHIKKEHKAFHYIYYILKLEWKEDIDYNAQEIEIEEKIMKNDLSWFPINRSLSIEKQHQKDKND